MPRRKTKKRNQYIEKGTAKPSTFKSPGGEITVTDLLRLSDKTGISYEEIRRIYESMKSEKPK